MSGVIAGHLPNLPPTPPPAGPGARVPAHPVPFKDHGPELEKSRMGPKPKPVVVGEMFGCWRVVGQAESCPKEGVQVDVECAHCGLKTVRIAAYIRREPPNTHRSCTVQPVRRKKSLKSCPQHPRTPATTVHRHPILMPTRTR